MRTVRSGRCRIEYTVDASGGLSLSRCVPDYDVKLFEISSRLHPRHEPSKYYVLARFTREAIEEYGKYMPWMTIVSVRRISDPMEAEEILSDKYRMPLW